MKYINTLKTGETVSEIYLCKTKQELKTKAGKNYFSLTLQDKTGQADAKVWDLTPGIEYFDAMDFIHVDALVTSFQGALQLNVKRIRRAETGEYNESDYMPCSKYDVDEMYGELLDYAGSISEPHMRRLLEMFFVDDRTFIESFKQHSAAKSIHHGFIGGLVQHTLSVTKLCDFYTTRYTMLNRDLLITAALCHDIGKTRELSLFPANDYTDEGQLIGHIVAGVEMIDEKIKDIPGFPEKLANELRHCILAHHGELEYGSPKKPALIEAMALNLADNTDAKLETMTEALESSENTPGWLGYNKTLETNIRKTTGWQDRK